MSAENEIIVSIYEIQNRLDGTGELYFKQIFDRRGSVEYEILFKVYQEIYGKSLLDRSQGIGPFNSIEELQRYAFKLCQELEFQGIFVLPIDAFATLLEKVGSVDELWKEIRSSEYFLKNPERGQTGSGSVWKKIFT